MSSLLIQVHSLNWKFSSKNPEIFVSAGLPGLYVQFYKKKEPIFIYYDV